MKVRAVEVKKNKLCNIKAIVITVFIASLVAIGLKIFSPEPEIETVPYPENGSCYVNNYESEVYAQILYADDYEDDIYYAVVDLAISKYESKHRSLKGFNHIYRKMDNCYAYTEATNLLSIRNETEKLNKKRCKK